MTIAEQENELFAEWQSVVEGFVADGIVDELRYAESSPKLVFVLKEVHDTTDGGGWDLRKELTKPDRWQTWNVVTRWVKAIQNLPHETHWEELAEVEASDRKHHLASIVAMNLKKSPGGASSLADDISKFANDHADRLRQQFDLYNPDFVVCCGTAIPFARSVFKGVPREWGFTSRGMKYWEYDRGKYILDFYHPQARYPAAFLHFGLVDAVSELWKNR